MHTDIVCAFRTAAFSSKCWCNKRVNLGLWNVLYFYLCFLGKNNYQFNTISKRTTFLLDLCFQPNAIAVLCKDSLTYPTKIITYENKSCSWKGCSTDSMQLINRGLLMTIWIPSFVYKNLAISLKNTVFPADCIKIYYTLSCWSELTQRERSFL